MSNDIVSTEWLADHLGSPDIAINHNGEALAMHQARERDASPPRASDEFRLEAAE